MNCGTQDMDADAIVEKADMMIAQAQNLKEQISEHMEEFNPQESNQSLNNRSHFHSITMLHECNSQITQLNIIKRRLLYGPAY